MGSFEKKDVCTDKTSSIEGDIAGEFLINMYQNFSILVLHFRVGNNF